MVGEAPSITLSALAAALAFLSFDGEALRSMPARVLLKRMQLSRTQMALVIDEYGGTDGLASLEDIVEMLVGDIEDEHDDEEAMFTRQSDDVFIAESRRSSTALRTHRVPIGSPCLFGRTLNGYHSSPKYRFIRLHNVKQFGDYRCHPFKMAGTTRPA